jgi:hypothetical protein
MTTRVRTGAIGAACAMLVIIVVATGCGGGDGETTTEVVTDQDATGSEEPAATSTSEASDLEPEIDESGIVSGEASSGGTSFRFSLTSLERSGSTVVAEAEVEPIDGSKSLEIADLFSDGEYQDLTTNESGGQEESDVFDGIALIDPEGGKKYLVARDETGLCVCSNTLLFKTAKPGAPVSLQATLSAPPPEVTTVDVVVPNLETFTDVPLEG